MDGKDPAANRAMRLVHAAAVLLLVLGVGLHIAADRVDTTQRLCDLSLPLDPLKAAEKEADCQRFLAEGEANIARQQALQMTAYVAFGAFLTIRLATVLVARRRTKSAPTAMRTTVLP